MIWDFFKQKSFNDYGVAGLMGNLYAESGLNPQNLQDSFQRKLGYTDYTYTVAVDNGHYKNFIKDSAGYGLAQWTYWSRKENLYNMAKKQKVSVGDLNLQLNFLYSELQSYKLIDKLKNAKSVLEASNVILFNFEKPADQSAKVQKLRAEYGEKYYKSYGGTQMKYSVKNPPIQCYQKNSTCYKQTRTMEIKGILWHSTGANNPNLKRYVQPLTTDKNYSQMIALLGKNTSGTDWNHVSVQAGLNAWIGKAANGEVMTIQSMPWNYRPWGCGSGVKGSCNNGWIQFEICEDALTDQNYFNQVYKEACELTAYLCDIYHIDPNGTVSMGGIKVPTILCHADSYKLGLGSNHGDVNHWFKKYGKTMADVRKDVSNLLQKPVAAVESGYKAKVTASALNCRSIASANGSIKKSYPKGTILTIIKEQNGWGYTGEGWVSLTYVQKV